MWAAGETPESLPREYSMNRIRVGALVVVTILGLMVTTGANSTGTQRVDPDVRSQVESGELERFWIVLAEQADLSAASSLSTKREKTQYVFDRLQETATRTQAPLLLDLARADLSAQSFWVDNRILVTPVRTVSLDEIEGLASRSGVGRLDAVRPAINPESVPMQAATDSVANVLPVGWNIAATGALERHAAGITGAGVVVGISDSGVAFEHPALATRYRGHGVGHDGNWFDPSPAASPVPVDPTGHGTGTASVAVGSAPGFPIGMAPGAQWIACRGVGPGSNAASVLACLQWFLAPTDVNGQNPNPARAPDVTNHSYICPFCGVQTAFANLRAAGIATVGVTGNFGPACGSVFDPGTYNEILAVGATAVGDRNALIASYSSRGPTEGLLLVRPHLVAPGTDILAADANGPSGYINFSGTSFAAPHVAGAIALLWQQYPQLAGNVAATEQFLINSVHPRVDSAQECTGSPTAIPNNLYGHGFLQVGPGPAVFLNGFEVGQ